MLCLGSNLENPFKHEIGHLGHESNFVTFLGNLEKFKSSHFIGLAYQCKYIVFRFIIEYSSLRDFGP